MFVGMKRQELNWMVSGISLFQPVLNFFVNLTT